MVWQGEQTKRVGLKNFIVHSSILICVYVYTPIPTCNVHMLQLELGRKWTPARVNTLVVAVSRCIRLIPRGSNHIRWDTMSAEMGSDKTTLLSTTVGAGSQTLPQFYNLVPPDP